MSYFPRNPPKRTIRGVSNDTDPMVVYFTVGFLSKASTTHVTYVSSELVSRPIKKLRHCPLGLGRENNDLQLS